MLQSPACDRLVWDRPVWYRLSCDKARLREGEKEVVRGEREGEKKKKWQGERGRVGEGARGEREKERGRGRVLEWERGKEGETCSFTQPLQTFLHAALAQKFSSSFLC